MVLKGAGNYFRRGRRLSIDEDDKRRPLKNISFLLEYLVRLSNPSLLRKDSPFREKKRGDADGTLDLPAVIVAKVQDKTLKRVVFCEPPDRSFHLFPSLHGEKIKRHVSDIASEYSPPSYVRVDALSLDKEILSPGSFPYDRDCRRRSRSSANAIQIFHESGRSDRDSANGENNVSGFYARRLRWRTFENFFHNETFFAHGDSRAYSSVTFLVYRRIHSSFWLKDERILVL